MSRPTIFTPELGAAICEKLAECGSLRRVCRESWAPDRGTVARWVEQDIDGFAARYARAKELGVDAFVEETLEIADEPPAFTQHGVDSGDVANRKVRIETRRWLAEQMSRRYGPRSKVELTGADGGPVRQSIIIATGVPRAEATLDDLV